MNKKKLHKNKNFRFRPLDLILIPILLTFILLAGYFEYTKTQYLSNFNIEQTNVDYIIQTPSISQIESINNLEHINSITPYIYTSSTAVINNKTVKTELFVINNTNDLNNTMFSNDLLIKKSSKKHTNEIYIDETYATINNLNLDDKIVIKVIETNIEYNIKAIYKPDSRHSTGMTIVINNNDTKTIFDNRYGTDYKYSGAFLDSNNLTLTNSYLDSYIPEGDLLTREDFASDELYNAYLELRADTNFKLSIFNKENFLDQAHKKYDNNIILFRTLEYLTIILLCVAISIYPFIKVYKYQKTELIKDIKNNFILKQENLMFNTYFGVLLTLVCSISALTIFVNWLIYKIAFISVFNLLLFILPIFTIGLMWTLQSIILTRSFKKVEEKLSKEKQPKKSSKK